MKDITQPKKIAFCITCMNRLSHLKETLERNIQDNYLPEEVKFVLLDYNSNEEVDLWIYHHMRQYINKGILVYYNTVAPTHYLRSHSRNMVFQLANARLLCNLDADNFLGKGFAAFMVEEFSKQSNCFYTSNCSFPDIFGRVVVLQEDFYKIRGYNEALTGYGFEDEDLFSRLRGIGLIQKHFLQPEFYQAIRHSKRERIMEEYMLKNLEKMYISYINPYTSGILLSYKSATFAQYTLIDNPHLNVLADDIDPVNLFSDARKRITISNDFRQGVWNRPIDRLSPIQHEGLSYYEVNDAELQTEIIILLTSAINFHQAKRQIEENAVINPGGFGQGVVFKNFQIDKEIFIS